MSYESITDVITGTFCGKRWRIEAGVDGDEELVRVVQKRGLHEYYVVHPIPIDQQSRLQTKHEIDTLAREIRTEAKEERRLAWDWNFNDQPLRNDDGTTVEDYISSLYDDGTTVEDYISSLSSI